MVVRALVGPRPVLWASRCAMAWEMAAFSAAPSGRSGPDSGGLAMRPRSRLPPRGLAPGEGDDERRRERAVAAGAERQKRRAYAVSQPVGGERGELGIAAWGCPRRNTPRART